MLAFALYFGTGMSGTSKPSIDVEVNPLLVDWGEWPDVFEPDSTNTWPEVFAGMETLGTSEESTGYGGNLYHLVDECARRLELRNVSCGGDAHQQQGEYKIPFMETGDLPCGFQVRIYFEVYV